MQNVIVPIFAQGKVGDMALLKFERAIGSPRRMLLQKPHRIARQYGETQSQVAFQIGMTKSGQQPFPEKAGASRDEETFPAQLFQFRGRVVRNMDEVPFGQ